VSEAFTVSHGRMAGRVEPGWQKCSTIVSGGKAERRVRGGAEPTKRSAKDVTGRERSWTAFARERRWSETDLKSKVGV